jgi:hypothetical protein
MEDDMAKPGFDAKPICPLAWCRLLEYSVQCPQSLAKKLWAVLWPSESHDLMYHLGRMIDCQGHHVAGVAANLEKAISPALLFKLTLRVAPENGCPRSTEVVALEKRILAHVNREGRWQV